MHDGYGYTWQNRQAVYMCVAYVFVYKCMHLWMYGAIGKQIPVYVCKHVPKVYWLREKKLILKTCPITKGVGRKESKRLELAQLQNFPFFQRMLLLLVLIWVILNSTLKWKWSPKTVSPNKSPLIRLLPVKYLDEVTKKEWYRKLVLEIELLLIYTYPCLMSKNLKPWNNNPRKL